MDREEKRTRQREYRKRIGPLNYAKVKAWRARLPKAVLKRKRKEEARKYREKYRQRVRDYGREWKRKHSTPKSREVEMLKKREYRKTQRFKDAQRARMQRYLAKREELYLSLAGRLRPSRCELCNEAAKTVFDHCHTSGKFRGWLCNRCNRTLGHVKDSQELLRKMVDYLAAGGRGHGKADDGGEEQTPRIRVCASR
jgi:hypothetical protein